MGKMNVDPIAVFPDGSQLLVSTQYSKEGNFFCDLYMASAGDEGRLHLRVVLNHLEASTCLAAQEIAYSHAQRLYPDSEDGMKKPPYLIWQGPVPHT